MNQLTRWITRALAVAALAGAAPALAADPPEATATRAAAPAEEAAPERPSAPRHGAADETPGRPVTAVKQVTIVHPAGEATDTQHGCLGDVLVLEMGPGDVGKMERWAEAKGRALAVFLDGKMLAGLAVTAVSEAHGDVLRVDLERTPENRTVWGSLLGGRVLAARKVEVRVGLDDGSPLSRPGYFQLSPLQHRTWIPILLLALAIVVGLVVAGSRTTMVRDGLTPDRKLGTFSLARMQAAVWFAQVVVAFLWIWAITGAADTLTESCLVLLGIGSGTALGGTLIDKSNKNAPRPVLPCNGMVEDLLTDENGYALHRYQMVVWTAVLSVLFWSSVYRHLAMPDFDATLLGLMGLSSGTYLGLKAPEQKPGGEKPVAMGETPKPPAAA